MTPLVFQVEGQWNAPSILTLLAQLSQQAPSNTVIVTGHASLKQWMTEWLSQQGPVLPQILTLLDLGLVLDPGTSSLSPIQIIQWQHHTMAKLRPAYPELAQWLSYTSVWSHAMAWLWEDPHSVHWIPGMTRCSLAHFKEVACQALDELGLLPPVRVWHRLSTTSLDEYASWATGKTLVILVPLQLDEMQTKLIHAVLSGCQQGVVIEQLLPQDRPANRWGATSPTVIPMVHSPPPLEWWYCETERVQSTQLAQWLQQWSASMSLDQVGICCPTGQRESLADSLRQWGIPVRIPMRRELRASVLTHSILAQLSSPNPSYETMIRQLETDGWDMDRSDDELVIWRALYRIIKESKVGGELWAKWAKTVIVDTWVDLPSSRGGVWITDLEEALQLPMSRWVVVGATSLGYPYRPHPLAPTRWVHQLASVADRMAHILMQSVVGTTIMTPFSQDGVAQTPSPLLKRVARTHISTIIEQVVPFGDDGCRLAYWQRHDRNRFMGALSSPMVLDATQSSPLGASLPTAGCVEWEGVPRYSATQLQRYLECPHWYWMSYHLRLRPHEPDELDLPANESGVLAHRVMEWAAQYLQVSPRHWEGLHGVIEQKAKGEWGRNPRQWQSFNRLMGQPERPGGLRLALQDLMEWTEVTLVGTETRPPAKMLPNGVGVHGVLDLVVTDHATQSQVVVDYKTGRMPSITDIREHHFLPVAIYSWLLGRGDETGWPSVMLWQIKAKEQKKQWVLVSAAIKEQVVPKRAKPHVETPSFWLDLENRLLAMVGGIQEQRWMPNDSGVGEPDCDRCPYRLGCRYRDGGGEGGTSG